MREPTKLQSPFPNLHALLIGIDTYASVPNLSGASKDANSVENFLCSDLSVPPSQITNLRNEGATRSGILAAFDELRRNPNIAPFDPIVIYYAGHGCEVDTPSMDWSIYKEKTQCLVPWDAGIEDADGSLIPPIPDYTIGALLYALAAEKGNNITVIFDCCHSASGTRGIQTPYNSTYRGLPVDAKLSKWAIDDHSTPNPKLVAYRARRLDAEDLPRLTREIDVEILQPHMRIHKNMKVAQPGSQHTSPDRSPSSLGFCRFGRSHILLAACGHAQLAYECATSDSGYFTSALLQRLRSSRIHSLQSPVCEGDDTGRLFFSATVPEEFRVFVPMQQLTGGYAIKAGIAQGVIPGSVYGIYEDDVFSEGLQSGDKPVPNQDLPLCGIFTANPFTTQKLYPCQSWCDLHTNATIPSHPRARLLTRGDSHTFGAFLTSAYKDKLPTGETLEAGQGVVQVDSLDKAKVILDIDERSSQMTVELAGFAGTLLYRCNPSSARVQRILFSMAQWDWHLYRGPTANANVKKERARLQMYQLSQAGPVPVLLENGVANLAASSGETYGFRIKNLFNRRLYAYLFYFSTVSQSIKPLFLSVYGNGYVDAPLEANGELTIGYGNDDMISGPISFRFAPDVGYFKLFLTTLPGDFDSMVQPSPFVESDKVQIMTFGNGDEYSDGIEIRNPGSIGRSQGASVDHSTMADFPDFSTDSRITPAADAIGSQYHSITGPVGIGYSPRMLTASETSERFDKQDVWDVVTLKVVLGNAS
ncbi:unnamed protein product [Rhizoctonia solani]|uniref:Peptidase C14 caspase domain-containing protein n=1 Tax=Rhizoctonia solani TaxID=456999 RepID=A0A8H3CX66_9AGAM|nr:unnamed protein product [Rhizoctonia solani]